MLGQGGQNGIIPYNLGLFVIKAPASACGRAGKRDDAPPVDPRAEGRELALVFTATELSPFYSTFQAKFPQNGLFPSFIPFFSVIDERGTRAVVRTSVHLHALSPYVNSALSTSRLRCRNPFYAELDTRCVTTPNRA